MRILCIGDVVGSIGCNFLRKKLPVFKKTMGIDFVICNAENSADGNGVTPTSAEFLFDSGVDAITLGNHTFRRKEAYEYIDENLFVARPANFPSGTTPFDQEPLFEPLDRPIGKFMPSTVPPLPCLSGE